MSDFSEVSGTKFQSTVGTFSSEVVENRIPHLRTKENKCPLANWILSLGELSITKYN